MLVEKTRTNQIICYCVYKQLSHRIFLCLFIFVPVLQSFSNPNQSCQKAVDQRFLINCLQFASSLKIRLVLS